MSTESLRAVRELEREIGERLAAARASSEVTDRAATEARTLREAAAAEAEQLARARVAELVAAAERQATDLRGSGERYVAQLRAVAADRLDADVAELLVVVAPGADPATETPPTTGATARRLLEG